MCWPSHGATALLRVTSAQQRAFPEEQEAARSSAGKGVELASPDGHGLRFLVIPSCSLSVGRNGRLVRDIGRDQAVLTELLQEFVGDV